MNLQKCEKLFSCLKKHNPNPTTELNYNTEFELLVAVILSAQATDISVNKATKDLFKTANTPKKMLKLGEAGLKKYIKSIGLYNSKANNIIKTCQRLVDKHNSTVPNTRQALEALHGVGRKTANVILNTAFGHNTVAVDTHIFRVSNRTHLAPGKTPLAVERKLMKVIPKKYIHDAHHWLVLHGRYICIARKPKCPECLINKFCEYEKKTEPSSTSSRDLRKYL